MQFFEGFADTPLGQQPAGWTKQWRTSGSWVAVEDPAANDLRALQQTSPELGDQGLSWDTVGLPVDCEIVAKAKVDVIGFAGLTVRTKGSATQITRYHTMWGGNSLRIQKVVNGGMSQTIAAVTKQAPPYGTYYYMRFRVQGNVLSAKGWLEDQPEPETWDCSVTDTSIPDGGWVGLVTPWDIGARTWDFVGVGIDGDPAPLSPPPDSITILADTKQRVYSPVTILTDTRQRIYVPASALADTRQLVYSPAQVLADTKQRVYSIAQLLSDTRQRIYRPVLILADTRQRILPPGSAVTRIAVTASIRRAVGLVGSVGRSVAVTARVTRRDEVP